MARAEIGVLAAVAQQLRPLLSSSAAAGDFGSDVFLRSGLHGKRAPDANGRLDDVKIAIVDADEVIRIDE